MKLSIKADKLKEMVARSVKGASNNKMLPITGLMAIELKNNILTLITTDATNYLYIKDDKVDGDDFYVVVQVDKFSKLITKLTCDTVSLELKENELEIIGNGKYKIELPLDENGEPIRYPNPLSGFDFDTVPTEINLSTVKTILNTVKPALAVTMEVPCYTGYYVGDNVVATDTYKICGMGVKLLDTPTLISAEMMNLLDVMTEEKISVTSNDNKLVFRTTDCIVYGTVMDGIDDYAINAINGLLNEEFESVCKLPKNTLLQLLDRLSLFVGTYDKNGIYLTFTNEGVVVSSKASNGTELIKYSDSKNFKDFTCCVDIEMLRTQVKAQASDVIELWYGKDNAIRLTNGDITQIIALLEDDRISE
jgi:DNA polymerase III sliding clamp (beta) subunit (PCNA family)